MINASIRPKWDQGLLEDEKDLEVLKYNMVITLDGSDNFTTISKAIEVAPAQLANGPKRLKPKCDREGFAGSFCAAESLVRLSLTLTDMRKREKGKTGTVDEHWAICDGWMKKDISKNRRPMGPGKEQRNQR
ncbi:hypothetical protein V8G54_011330 [Vigna mungo]|uniref:Uncharacterized protein n=1 Tax=Vigna mungo TaxID=3915 RepID=A0AAQ3RZI1_VIGMU